LALLLELKELQDKRAKLEDESLSLKEKQKRLEERAKGLEQKIIQELSSKNDETRQNISHLESKVNDLEQRLGRITEEPKTHEAPNEILSETSDAGSTDGLSVQINREAIEKSEEEKVAVVTDRENPSAHADFNEEQDSEMDKTKGQKKRKFF
jgi:chromosome segregation ATPase